MVRIRPAQSSDATFLAWAMLSASRSHLPKGWFDIVRCGASLHPERS